MKLFDLPLCVIDVETTGASFAYGDRVVELGIVRLERGQVRLAHCQMFNPGRPMSRGAMAVTGITDLMLVDKPAFCDAWPVLRPMIAGSIVVGHNVSFDIGFLDGECRRFGETLAGEIGEGGQLLGVIDTVRLARKQFGRGGNGLAKLAARLEIVVETAHRALADCHTTARVLEKLLHPHGGWEVTLESALALQGGPSKRRADPQLRLPILEDVAETLISGRPVNITYLDVGLVRSQRTVTPIVVRRVRGHLTLIAHCHVKNDRRMFKLDRIVAASAIDEGSATS